MVTDNSRSTSDSRAFFYLFLHDFVRHAHRYAALDEVVEHVYAKYEGMEIFTFHSERFDLEKPEGWIEPPKREKKYINMHKDVIKDDD